MKKNNLEVLYVRHFYIWDDKGSYDGHAMIARDPANNLWIGNSWRDFLWDTDYTVEWYPVRKICYPRDYVNQIQFYKDNKVYVREAGNGDWIKVTDIDINIW